MGVAFLMKVMESIHHLMEIGPGNFFREFAGVGHKIEKFAPSDVLQYDGETAIGDFVFLLVSGVFPDTDEFDQIFVVQLLHDVEFVLESLQGGGFLFVLLDGHEPAVFVLAQLDPALKQTYCAW